MSDIDEWSEGDRVVALVQVLEEGPGGTPNPNAAPCRRGWVHAEPGEFGIVVHTQQGSCPTVRWDRTGTATCVIAEEAGRAG